MKRAAELAPLSREHHEALVLARRAANADLGCAEAAAQREHLLQRWRVQFEPHFAAEERHLLPALVAAGEADAAARAAAEHEGLRRLVERLRQGELQALPAWGAAMQAHVRFEERELFPLAERVLDLAALFSSAP